MQQYCLAPACIIFFAAVGLSPVPCRGQQVLPDDHRHVMYFVNERGGKQPVTTQSEWQTRRQQILAGMQQAMGPLPSFQDLPDLEAKILEETQCPGYRRLRISFVCEGHDRIPAYLLLPDAKQSQRFPAMLALHQTVPMGKDEPAGLGGSTSLHYGHELAQRGYVVLCPDYPSFGEYAEYDFEKDDYLTGTMKGIFNHMRCVDFLVSRPEVDPDRIGVIGHSLGGHNAIFVGVFDERLKVIVSSCGWTPFHDYYEGNIEGWTSLRYMPTLKDNYQLDPDKVPFDFYELIAALAPRGFFSCSPLHDSNFEVAGVKKGIAEARKVYQLHSADDNLRAEYPDSQHDFENATRLASYEFIDRFLKPERKKP